MKTTATTRLGGLDGLRGIAAVIVVVWHALLTTSIPERVPHLLGSSDVVRDVATGSLAWWLFDTPLRIFTMGINAVSVFFVLSGFVLSIPVFRGKALDLWNYFPRRVLRLWLPSAAAVILAVTVILLTPQRPAAAESAWGEQFSFPTIEPSVFLRSFFLITGANDYNNPLWSLKWEMLFSLVLPVVLIIGLCVRGTVALWASIVACAVLSGIGEGFEVSALQYGTMFLAGVFAARLVADRPATPPRWTAWMLFGCGLAAIAVPDMFRTVLGGDMHGHIGRPLGGFVVLGATLLVLALTVPSGITQFFQSRPVRFLGRLSFSLYLVHAPLLLAGVHIFGDARLALWATVPLSFVIAWLFLRFVEDPAARLARRAGDAASRRFAVVPARDRQNA